MTAQIVISYLLVLVLLSQSVGAFQPVTLVRNAPIGTSSSSSLDAVSRREALTTASSAAASIVVASSIALPNAQAASTKSTAPDIKKFAFNGIFKDPKHPTGFRIIAAAPNKDGTMTLQDNPDGEVFNIPLKARTDDKTGEVSLIIDFSEKGGLSNVVATVNKKDSSIVFPDGNIWKKDTKGIDGVYVDGFAPYPKFRRIIREVDSRKNELVVCMVSGKKTFVVAGKAGTGNYSNVYIDFPGNKPCTGKVNTKKGTILWPDGNVWTRV